MSSILQIKKLTESAITPERSTEHSAGYDLHTTESATLQPGERKLFKTGLLLAIPKGMYGRIAPRSGLAFKNGIDIMAGVIDEDYRGELGIVVINLGQQSITLPQIKDGKTTPIAQIIFEFYNKLDVQIVNELSETNRGIGGFGHTDDKKEVEITTKSNLLDKWKETHADVESHTKYETIVKEREKLIT